MGYEGEKNKLPLRSNRGSQVYADCPSIRFENCPKIIKTRCMLRAHCQGYKSLPGCGVRMVGVNPDIVGDYQRSALVIL